MISEKVLDGLKDMKAEISVVLKDLTNDRLLFVLDEKAVFPSASIIKLPIMVEALKQVERGKYTLEQRIPIKPEDKVSFSLITDMCTDLYTFKDLITLMIIVSDNTATNVLIDLLGAENINDTIREMGMSNTRLMRKMMDFAAAKEGRQNTTSAEDVARLMELIYKHQLADARMCELMLDIMKRQKDRELFIKYIPDETIIAHKTGELDNLNHDIGIFYLENVTYLLGVFVRNAESSKLARDYVAQISKQVYDYFTDQYQHI